MLTYLVFLCLCLTFQIPVGIDIKADVMVNKTYRGHKDGRGLVSQMGISS